MNASEPPLRFLLLWGRWTPYHHARLRGLREILGARGRVIAVQYCAGSRDYGWMSQVEEPGLLTLRHAACETRFSSRAVLGELLPLLLRERPDVIFVPSYWHWSLATALLARLLGLRVVMMNESHGATVRPGRLRGWLRRQAMTLFDAALLGGRPQLRYFESLGMPRSRIAMGYDVVDNAFFARHAAAARADAASTRARLALPRRYILWAGRMEPKKDVATLLTAYVAAAGELGPEGPAVLLAGDGSERDATLRHATALTPNVLTSGGADAAGGAVVFAGFFSPADLAAAYALADCVVLCSKVEEWGLVVNEAMAAGTPVVLSSAAGCAEDLLPGPDSPAFPGLHVRRGGIVFDTGDETMRAKCLVLLHKDTALPARLRRETGAAIAPFDLSRFGHAAVEAARIALG